MPTGTRKSNANIADSEMYAFYKILVWLTLLSEIFNAVVAADLMSWHKRLPYAVALL